MNKINNYRHINKPGRLIRLAIFDMDGTVFESHLDWQQIREELQIQPGGNILRDIYKKDQVDHRRLEILENYEKENTLKTSPISGVPDFLDYLKTGNVITVLLTNNNRENTSYLLLKFNLNFDLVITREMKLWKPEPDAFFYIMDRYGFGPSDTISIGDSHYDVKASLLARIPYIFIIKTPRSLKMEDPDIIFFENYFDLKAILKKSYLV